MAINTLRPETDTPARRRYAQGDLDNARAFLLRAMHMADTPEMRGAHAEMGNAVSCIDDAAAKLEVAS